MLRYIDLVTSAKIRLRSRLLLAVWLALPLAACTRHSKATEMAYVSAPQVALRDRVAAVFNKKGTVKNGEHVQVLEREKRFARIRTQGGVEGWMEQRYLVSQQVFDGFQKLSQQAQNDPVQATGTTRNDTNIHLDPGREAEHLYQLNQGAKVSVLKRATAEKVLPGALPMPKPDGKPPNSPTPMMEDWWLIRDPEQHVGWVLARLVDIDAPLEVAQYAEGQRIVAFFALDEVVDGDKKVPQYLVLLTEPRDGMDFDFNQARVYTWNVKRHRYETAYRERNLNGVLPATVTQETFEKDGTLPVFVLRVKDDAGNIVERKYKLNTPIVKRILAPGEEPQKAAARKKGQGR
ncbi:MAG: SH3 domain-containing protein [Terriglobales bacterium]